jgi:nucleoside-diphosphate-sugar epimerase
MVTVVLKAAAGSPSVQRVVITSSCVTLVPFEWNFAPDGERVYTADDINANPKKPYGSPMEAYWASKALARLATREFVETNKVQFDYVNLLPSVVIGPDDRICAKSGKSSALTVGTRASVLASALTANFNSSFPFVGVPVHVRDVARAHVDAAVYLDKITGNNEYILSSDTPEGIVWDRDTQATARKHFPREVEERALPLEGSLTTVKWRLNAEKTKEAFGWEMTGFEETIREMLRQYLALEANDKRA